MRINILFPGSGRHISGGFMVLFRYANGLAELGHKVTLTFTPFQECSAGLINKTIARIKFLAGKLNTTSWYPKKIPFHKEIDIKWIPTASEKWLIDSDIVILSFWHSAEWLRSCPISKGKRYYLIQEYEYYMSASTDVRSRMAANFKSGTFNMAISPAVIDMLRACNADMHAYTPNGIDQQAFWLQKEVSDPCRVSIGFPSRSEFFKCTPDAIKALEIVREKHNKVIHVWSFGNKECTAMPNWVDFHITPSNEQLCSLYNTSMIFVVPSLYEGWGLPGSEAMACGAALVSTDSGGVHAYAENEKTALLSPPRNPKLLAKNILRLLENDSLRKQIASNGVSHIKQFTWEKAVSTLEGLLLKSEPDCVEQD